MKTILLVGIGGGLGSIFRYLTSLVITKYFPTTFPLPTFTANILGCLIIGLFLGLFDRQQLVNSDLKFLFVTGFCGGYTTFSAFSVENFNLLQSGNYLTALLYISLSVFISLLSFWLGIYLTSLMQ